MRCNEVTKLLMAYIDGRLPESLAEKLEAHLDVCPLCREEYTSEVEMTAALKTDTTGYAGAFFVDDVMRWIDSSLEVEYARLKVNRIQRVVMSVSAACIFIVAYLIWQMDWFGIWGRTPIGNYLAYGFAAIGQWFSAVGAMIYGYFKSGELIYHSSASQVAELTSGYLSIIIIVTVLALITCIGLVGGFRQKLVEELRICSVKSK